MDIVDHTTHVSVVIPVFNRRDLVVEAIDSVFAQESASLKVEVIVVDDSSTDDTLAVLGIRYGKDSRVRILSNIRSKGPAGARNSGILSAKSPFLAFLDSDDLYLPGHLAAALEVFNKYPHVGLIFGRMLCEKNGVELLRPMSVFEKTILRAPKLIEDKNTIIFSPDYFMHLLETGCYFGLCSVVMRTEAAQQLMNENLGSSEDYEFWLRMSRILVFACLKEPQVCVRRNGENLSTEDPERVTKNHLLACRLVLTYKDLSSVEKKLINKRIANASFDLAFCYTRNGCSIKALGYNIQSIRYGLIWHNLFAIAKLPIRGIIGVLKNFKNLIAGSRSLLLGIN